MSNKTITIGSRVTGLVGPRRVQSTTYVEPDGTNEAKTTCKTCKAMGHEQWNGIVIASALNQQWTVFWIKMGFVLQIHTLY